MSFGYFVDNHVSLLKEEPFRLQYFIENVERRPCRASHPLISWRRRISSREFRFVAKQKAVNLRGHFFFLGEFFARRCFRNQSKAYKALNQLAFFGDLYSLLFSEWNPANVMPRNIFLLHFQESHPIHQHRKKCAAIIEGNLWARKEPGTRPRWSSINADFRMKK